MINYYLSVMYLYRQFKYTHLIFKLWKIFWKSNIV